MTPDPGLALSLSRAHSPCVAQAYQCGAADYLIKPLRKNEVATLWQVGSRRGRAAELYPIPMSEKVSRITEPVRLGHVGEAGLVHVIHVGAKACVIACCIPLCLGLPITVCILISCAQHIWRNNRSKSEQAQLGLLSRQPLSQQSESHGHNDSTPEEETPPLGGSGEDGVGGGSSSREASTTARDCVAGLSTDQRSNRDDGGGHGKVVESSLPGIAASTNDEAPVLVTLTRHAPEGRAAAAAVHWDIAKVLGQNVASALGLSSEHDELQRQQQQQRNSTSPSGNREEKHDAELAAAVLGSLRHHRSALIAPTLFLPAGDGGRPSRQPTLHKLRHPDSSEQEAAAAVPVVLPGPLLPAVQVDFSQLPLLLQGGSFSPTHYLNNIPPEQLFSAVQAPPAAPPIFPLPDSLLQLLSALSAGKQRQGPPALDEALPFGTTTATTAAAAEGSTAGKMAGVVGEDKGQRRLAAVAKYLLKRKDRCFKKKVWECVGWELQAAGRYCPLTPAFCPDRMVYLFTVCCRCEGAV